MHCLFIINLGDNMHLKLQKKYYLIPLALIIIYFLYVNQTTFLMAEDFSYSLVLQPDYSYLKIVSFQDVIKATFDYFFNNSGRIVSNFMNSYLLFLGLDVFKLINGTMVAAQIYILVQWVSFNKSWKEKLLISMLLSLCLFFVPSSVFDEVFVWHTGAIFYSLPTLCILAYLTPFVYALQNRNFPLKKKYSKACFAITFAVGSAFIPENYSTAVIAIGFVILFYCTIRDKKLNRFLLLCFLSHFIFSFICILAPGSLNRIDGEGRGLSISFSTITQYFKYQFVMVPFATLAFFLTTFPLLKQVMNKTRQQKFLFIFIILFFIPLLLAALLNTQLLYGYDIITHDLMYYLRMPDDFFMWAGMNKKMIVTLLYYFSSIGLLLILYIYLAIKKKDMFLIILLFASTLPILSLIFVGGAEQRVVYWPFLSTIALSIYILIHYLDIRSGLSKGIIALLIISGTYTWFYHFDYVSDNISIVRQRNAIIENLPNSTGEVILPRVRATVHGSVGEDTWDYWVMREYYDIQDRKVSTK